jgi:Secretion system C-terminal sorting domain
MGASSAMDRAIFAALSMIYTSSAKPRPMRSTLSFLPSALCLALNVVDAASSQAQVNCQFTETFSGAGLPAGWTMEPAQVERLDGAGNGTGTFTAPFAFGTSIEANAEGYFPVPNDPVANRFAMANDDAPPCDCNMADVGLITPIITLSTITAPALSFRYYHDGRPFNGRAWLDVSTDGSVWNPLAELTEALGKWQSALIDLAPYANGSLQLRFRYNDNGDWSSGFAVDDVCVFGRTANDLSVTRAWLGDPRTSTFNTSDRSLGYTLLPVEQQSPLATSVRIRNLGTQPATGISIDGTLTLNGGQVLQMASIVCNELAPLRDTVIQWTPGWTYAEAGSAELSLSLTMAAIDDQTQDNTAQLGYRLTAEDQSGHAMGIDNDLPGTWIEQLQGSSTGCRFELIGPESQVHGISARFAGGTTVGTPIKALLTDANLNLLSSSTEHAITQADLDLSFAGGTVYLPLDSTVDISGNQDVIALIRFTGDSGSLWMAAGGMVPVGAAWMVASNGFSVSYPEQAPIVRIHLSEPATALPEQGLTVHAQSLVFVPNPANDATIIAMPSHNSGPWELEVLDTQGRRVLYAVTAPVNGKTSLDLSEFPTGTYVIRLKGAVVSAAGRLVVIR